MLDHDKDLEWGSATIGIGRRRVDF
jgi:hypothetical protein